MKKGFIHPPTLAGDDVKPHLPVLFKEIEEEKKQPKLKKNLMNKQKE